jgi:hypothetical protein
MEAQELHTLRLVVEDLNSEVEIKFKKLLHSSTSLLVAACLVNCFCVRWQIARLQSVIGRMHVSDINSLRRAYNSMVQHCGALESESRVRRMWGGNDLLACDTCIGTK